MRRLLTIKNAYAIFRLVEKSTKYMRSYIDGQI